MNLSLEKFIDGFNEFLLHESEEKGIIEFGKGARDFYEEPLDFNDKEFMEIMILDEKEEKEIEPEIQEIPAATALSEAGVKFERGSDNNLMNIKFKDGVLTIPELAVAELTEPLFRNLIAFEQCYHGRSQQITSYAVFMDKLINSDKDIKLLSKKKILANWLSVEDGSNFFNKLYTDTVVKEFHYDKLCAEVNKYYQVGWHKQLEILRRDYVANPWTIISLIAGIILLVLTLLQTIFTIYQ
ncbi:unnamed protein product [Prunus armeniaca]|uniref:Uncharacterized protein n=1 Tax=Prunus armeniaca TaxID=36596 RepID=A0A6J5TLL2_PRUAR|nr:unnamed protein product [Prunus armeniaca]